VGVGESYGEIPTKKERLMLFDRYSSRMVSPIKAGEVMSQMLLSEQIGRLPGLEFAGAVTEKPGEQNRRSPRGAVPF
jgi:hypothetical protein